MTRYPSGSDIGGQGLRQPEGETTRRVFRRLARIDERDHGTKPEECLFEGKPPRCRGTPTRRRSRSTGRESEECRTYAGIGAVA